MTDGIPLNPDQYTSTQELNQGQAANGTEAPENSKPHVVQRGECVSQIMADNGMDYNDPADVQKFYELNPQFAPPNGRSDDLIYPDEVIYLPEDATGGTDGTDGTDGTGEAEGTDGADGTDEANLSEEAQEVDDAQQDYDRAVENYNAHPSDENWDAVDTARQELEAAILAEAEAEVADMQPPPSSYEEYQQAVVDAAGRIAGRHPDDRLVQSTVDDVVSQMTSVEYLEGYQAQAHQESAEADRRQEILEGAQAVHESPEAQETAEASQAVADARQQLDELREEGATQNAIDAAEADLAEAEQRLDEAMAAEINARIEASGATGDQVADVEQQVRQDMLSRVPSNQRADVADSFDSAREAAATMRGTDAAAEAHADNPTDYTEDTLNSAVEAEIQAGLDAYRAENPDASDEDILAEAERLGDAIVERNGDSDGVQDAVDRVVNDYD